MSSSSSTAFSPPGLSRFFIFNPKFGPREDNDHEKILFFHPSNISLDAQMKDVGLSEALTNITKNFSRDAPCEVMHTKKMRWIFHNPEPGYWMVMIFTNSVTQRSGQSAEYSDTDLNDVALSRLLEKTYEQHRLFNGPFESTYQDHKDVSVLRNMLSQSFGKILRNLNASHANIFGALGGMTFLPCSPGTFMKLHTLVSTVSMNVPNVSHVLLLFRDMLVWSDLDQENTQILYKWWCEYFARKAKPPTEPRFSYGVQDASKVDSLLNTPLIYIKDVDPDHPYRPLGSEGSAHQQASESSSAGSAPTNPSSNKKAEASSATTYNKRGLVVLQGYGVTCIFLIDPATVEDRNFYKLIFDLISPALKESSTMMAKALEGSEQEEYMYLYFNSMNLALKSTIKNKSLEIPRETMNTLLDMHESFLRSSTYQGEVIVKTATDSWIIGKRAESRLLFVLIDQRSKSILDVADHVQAICAKAFRGIFYDQS